MSSIPVSPVEAEFRVGKREIKGWSVLGERFELDEKYKVVDYLGAGAYGVVCAARDEELGKTVAIKKCKHIFQSRTLAKRTLREIRLLRLLDHDNVIKISTILQPTDEIDKFNCIYVVFEVRIHFRRLSPSSSPPLLTSPFPPNHQLTQIMETDLASIIRSGQKLRDAHVQYFTLQILRALDYLHSAHIVHRDLKPRNLLVNGDCHLKVPLPSPPLPSPDTLTH